MFGLLLAACSKPDVWPQGTALVSNLTAASWSWGSLDGLTPFVSAVELDPSCAECMGFQGRIWQDQVILTWSEHAGGADDLRSRVGGVDMSGDPIWTLDRLNFTAVPGVCEADPADPCAPSASEGSERRVCQLTMAHDVAMVSEDDEGVRFWVADSSNARVLEVWLPTGDTCGQVQTVLDQSHPDWDVYNAPNRVLTVGDDVWMEAKGGLPSTDAGMEQGAHISSGKLVAWTDEDGWNQRWEFPTDGFLNSPHGLLTTGTEVLYAHSLGDSWEWGAGTGGSIGTALVEDDGLVYAYDAKLDTGYLQFARSLTDMGDGTYLVLDSGCFDTGSCDYPSQAWRVRLPEIKASGLSGAWDRNSTQINWQTAEVLNGPLWTTDDTLYAIAWVTPSPI